MPLRFLGYALLVAAAIAAVPHIPYRGVEQRFGGNTLALHTARVMEGDDARWAQPAFDDRAWPERLVYRLRMRAHWIRRTITLDEHDETRELAMYVAVFAKHETFWDGVLIGRGDGATDDFHTLAPAQRTRGRHLLAIRITPAAPAPTLVNALALGDLVPMIRRRIAAQVLPVAGLGLFVVIGAYFLAIGIGARKARDVVFALLCFAAAALVVAETWRWLFGMTYDWQLARLRTIEALTFAIAWLLPTFFAIDFGLRRPARWMLAFAITLAAAPLVAQGSDMRCLAMFAASVALSVVVTIEAWRGGGAQSVEPEHRPRTWVAPLGIGALVVSLATGGYGFSDGGFFLAFCVLIGGLLVSMRSEYQHALLRAARLEIELLQKSIEPHFLANTLTAVMEWIEEDPAAGLRFLEALADELRIFGEVSKEKLIPLSRELELCRSHLSIMSCRKAMRFELETEGVASAALLPPATLHTLLENAITHNRYDGDRIVFRLAEEENGGTRRYVLDAPLAARAPRNAASEGLGLRYVRARLEESFPGRWSLEARALERVWRTTIEVPA